MNCNILQIISLSFIYNGDYQKSYFCFCHKMMKQSYIFRNVRNQLRLDRYDIHTNS